MEERRPPRQQGNKSKSRRAKVKSGCKTCKLRKVKCDEDWPACRRCRDSGRRCDGYGVWGGGSSASSQPVDWSGERPRGSSCMPVVLNKSLSSPSNLASALSDEEHYYFEWFVYRTAPKLPGAFVSPSATALLYQASSHEPAVLHAVLALSCVHQVEMKRTANDRQDRFILNQYNKAINGLQRRLAMGDYRSTRLTLAACLVFVFLELLRGGYQSGLNHLHCGLQLLQQMLKFKGSGQSFIDIGIIGAILRLYVQAKLLGQETIRIDPALLAAQHDATTTVFDTPFQARRVLEHLYLHLFELQERVKQCTGQGAELHSHTQTYQHYILRRLKTWHTTYNASIYPILASYPNEMLPYRLLHLYHTLCELMTITATTSTQMVFDDETDRFLDIISQSIHIYRILYSEDIFTTSEAERSPAEASSISDIGWIPPLYYTAVKCRVHRIRLQAIRLIELSVHREGMWDAPLVATIAKKVMQIEERDLNKSFWSNNNFDLRDLPQQDDLGGPVPSNSCRLSDVDVVLPMTEKGRLMLTGWAQDVRTSRKVFEGEYDLELKLWTEKNQFIPSPTLLDPVTSFEVVSDPVQLPAWSFGATNPPDLFGFLVKPTHS